MLEKYEMKAFGGISAIYHRRNEVMVVREVE
jgi:hypothetical protein